MSSCDSMTTLRDHPRPCLCLRFAHVRPPSHVGIIGNGSPVRQVGALQKSQADSAADASRSKQLLQEEASVLRCGLVLTCLQVGLYRCFCIIIPPHQIFSRGYNSVAILPFLCSSFRFFDCSFLFCFFPFAGSLSLPSRIHESSRFSPRFP